MIKLILFVLVLLAVIGFGLLLFYRWAYNEGRRDECLDTLANLHRELERREKL